MIVVVNVLGAIALWQFVVLMSMSRCCSIMCLVPAFFSCFIRIYLCCSVYYCGAFPRDVIILTTSFLATSLSGMVKVHTEQAVSTQLIGISVWRTIDGDMPCVMMEGLQISTCQVCYS